MTIENSHVGKFEEAFEEFKEVGGEYGKCLFVAAVLNPRIGTAAWTAQTHRKEVIKLSQMPSWFKGIEELLNLLVEFHVAFIAVEGLRPIAFLIERLSRDFQAAVELSLSGLWGSAVDTLRDTLEVEYLLTDFANEPTHIQEWLEAKTRKEQLKFEPVRLRERQAERQGLETQRDLQTSADYKIHSENLHVNAAAPMTYLKGVHKFDETLSLFPFYEIFSTEHRLSMS